MKSVILLLMAMAAGSQAALPKVAFEKLTDFDYRGTTYYTVKNLSLYECQGWCREEPECQAALFSFVLNPLTPVQETLCQLQNETSAGNPTAVAQRSVNTYYMSKLQLRTDHVCLRPWAFERVPNKMIRGLDNALIYTSTKEACLTACLNEHRFTCRSVEYNYLTLQCQLSDADRRTVGQFVQFADAQGVDYFENLCLRPTQACKGGVRSFAVPRIGVAEDKVAQYAGLHYYTDKELQVTSEAACRLACDIENEFLCRSFLYRGPPLGSQYNCQLFHLDHKTLPDGPSTYLNAERPLIDNGERLGVYQENICEKSLPSDNTLPVVFETEKVEQNSTSTRTDVNCDKTGTCYDVSVHCKDTRIAVQIRTNKPFNGRIYALGRSETCNIDVTNSDLFRLDLTMSGQDCNTQSVTGVYSNTVVLQHHSVVMTKADKIYKVKCTYDMSSKNITFGMMPIRDPEMISITSAPEAPPPRIRILDSRNREVETVRIGDKLTFRIEIPEDSKYQSNYYVIENDLALSYSS